MNERKIGYKHSTKPVPFIWPRSLTSGRGVVIAQMDHTAAGGVVTFIPTLVGEVLNETHSFCSLHCFLYVRLFI